MFKILVALSLLALVAAEEVSENTEQVRDKRGIYGGLPVAYSHAYTAVHPAPVVAYHPAPIAKVIAAPIAIHPPVHKYIAAPIAVHPPVTKIIHPVPTYTKYAYPAVHSYPSVAKVLPYYAHGYGYGYPYLH